MQTALGRGLGGLSVLADGCFLVSRGGLLMEGGLSWRVSSPSSATSISFSWRDASVSSSERLALRQTVAGSLATSLGVDRGIGEELQSSLQWRHGFPTAFVLHAFISSRVGKLPSSGVGLALSLHWLFSRAPRRTLARSCRSLLGATGGYASAFISSGVGMQPSSRVTTGRNPGHSQGGPPPPHSRSQPHGSDGLGTPTDPKGMVGGAQGSPKGAPWWGCSDPAALGGAGAPLVPPRVREKGGAGDAGPSPGRPSREPPGNSGSHGPTCASAGRTDGPSFEEEILKRIRAKAPLVFKSEGLELDISNVPSFGELCQTFPGKRGKAVGEDTLPSELFHHLPRVMTELFHPLMTKWMLRCHEPPLWKGGLLQDLVKNHLEVMHASGSRGILLQDHPGKRGHFTLRKRLLPFLIKAARITQHGGLPGKGTDIAGLTVRSFMAFRKAQNRPSGAFFVDLIGAFDRVIRYLFVSCEIRVGDLAQLFSTLGLPSDFLHCFLECILIDALEEAAVPSHLRALVSDSYSGSWFTTSGLASVTETQVGTRPGEPLGDLIFNYTMAAVLEDLDASLSVRGLVDVSSAKAT